VKLHLVLDHEGYLPCFGIITEGSVHDVKVAWRIPFPAGTLVVDDRGYNDYRLFAYCVPSHLVGNAPFPPNRERCCQ